jgi:hypothetical protein
MTTISTEHLLHALAMNVQPVTPLPHPTHWTRTWILRMLPVLVLGVAIVTPRRDLATRLLDPDVALEAGLVLLGAVASAWSAFMLVLPGFRRSYHLPVMLLPVAWLLWRLGRAGLAGLQSPSDLAEWRCFVLVLGFALVPVAVLVRMLQRGAPLAPGLTMIFVAMAGTGVADVAARFCHAVESPAHDLWHLAATFVVLGVAPLLAPVTLRWRTR